MSPAILLKLVVICVISSLLLFKLAESQITPLGSCGDGTWTKLGDSKCIKLVKEYGDWSTAKSKCQELSGSNPAMLLKIKSADEQEFITEFLFSSGGLINNVWIGGSRNGSDEFSWDDGTKMKDFSNWASNYPTNGDDRDCVAMQSGEALQNEGPGTWKNVNCGGGNWFVCEANQIWDALEVQTAILALRDAIDEIYRNPPVPIGFIYVELSGQPTPQSIWPRHTWVDVSGSYSGLFFRVVGGESAAFGHVQENNAPRVTEVDEGMVGENHATHIHLPIGGWSGRVKSGDHPDWGDWAALRFHTQGGEVRPRNMAMRLWKRSA